MTKLESNTFKQVLQNKKFINQVIEKYRSLLFLHPWWINIEYAKTDEDQKLADISVQPEYMDATITIYPKFFSKNKMIQESVLVHELCHCHTQEIWELMDNLTKSKIVPFHIQEAAIEKLTQTISVIAFNKANRG